MNKIEELEIKCLVNMPMMLDVMSNTINTLSEVFNLLFDQIKVIINKSNFKTSDDRWERGTIYPFASSDDFNRKKSYYDALKPELELLYKMLFSKKVGRKAVNFTLKFGYMLDGGQNVVYFQLFEDLAGREYINDAFVGDIKPLLAENWNFGYDEGDVYIEFAVDETLSEEKIHRLSNDFISIILTKLLKQ